MSRYKKIKTLGKGGFGSVHLAFDNVTKKQVAIKKYTSTKSKDIPYQVLREISIMRLITHPNLVQLLNTIDNNELVMEYAGENLETYSLSLTKTARIEILKPISHQILKAVEWLHNSGIIHRDLKPDNILCRNTANNHIPHIKICDFGLAKKFNTNRRHTRQIATLKYRSPEIFAGSIYNFAVDIWSIGCVLYEFILGSPLFDGESDPVVFSKIISMVPTTADEIQELGLSGIDLGKVNTDAFYKLPALYSLGEYPPTLNDELDCFSSMIHELLVINPDLRETATNALGHEYFSYYQGLDYSKFKLATYDTFYVRPKSYIKLELRKIYVDEMIETFKLYKLEKQTIMLAINIFDQYVNTCKPNTLNLDVISNVCLMIASKYLDVRPLNLDIFSTKFKESSIIEWENNIIQAINYNLNQPSLLDFKQRESHEYNRMLDILRNYQVLVNKSESEVRLLVQ
jgi:serine/threonine protein kinase